MLPQLVDALYHFFGVSGSGPFYGFWSGTGSDIGEVTLIGAVYMTYRKHNCHAKGCWRISKHPVAGTPYIVCRKHHPDIPDRGASHAHILNAHQEAQK